MSPPKCEPEQVWEALRRLVQDRLARRAGHLLPNNLDAVDLRLVVPLRRPPDDPGARELLAQIDARLEDALRSAAICRPGRAWCHRCGSAECEHSVPGSSRQVFAGYATTGMPRWEEFPQRCLDCKHPRVDELFLDSPSLITLVEDEARLTHHLLPAFRHRDHALIGQISAGFFPVRSRLEEGRGVVAVTIQAVGRRSRGRLGPVVLNVLGRAPSGEDLSALWDRHDDLPWRRAVAWGQSALNSLGNGDAHAGRAEPIRRVTAILGGVARRLEHERRARARRTQHAEERHAGGERPTRSAIEDARRARADDLLFDERRETLVILGDRGRTHFFTSAGRHVSSVRYQRDAIERKIAQGTWRRASTEERDSFLAHLGGH